MLETDNRLPEFRKLSEPNPHELDFAQPEQLSPQPDLDGGEAITRPGVDLRDLRENEEQIEGVKNQPQRNGYFLVLPGKHERGQAIHLEGCEETEHSEDELLEHKSGVNQRVE